MSSLRPIKPLAPDTCPQCTGTKTFVVSREKIECQHCGYVLRDAQQKPQQPPSAPLPPQTPTHDRTQYRVSYRIGQRDLEPFVEAAYTSALDYITRQQWDDAVRALRRCVDYRADFIDAHLWLSRMLEDHAERRDHLTTVLAHEPTHPEAMRELMILDGTLQPTGERFDEFTMPETRTVGGAVKADAHKVNCPRCGSPNLSDDDARGMVVCSACGYQAPQTKRSARYASVSLEMIKRRSQPVRWIVGERWLQCKACGSKRTIPNEQLAETCPFCGSKNVIQADALNTFQQPDSIAPFALSRKQALALVEEQLQSMPERMKGILNPNRVTRTQIEGVYLPFWVYDAVVDVRRSTLDRRGYERRDQPLQPYRTEQFPEMMNNILVCAVTSPARQLTAQLGKFKLGKATDYDPSLLAQHAAEIYSIDFDQAVMDAHEQVSTVMREQYQTFTAGKDMTVTVTSLIKQMMFRMVLLPVYSVTLFESDGEVRPALVNGHSGRVVLGRAQRVR
ncbi:MAG: TFIIB-type zinc ribbon-containing protein [Armatimonadetes bacterium]|nr:TFIIB-type zinc ribbon-containing protein [Anaerolineae bacterium]